MVLIYSSDIKAIGLIEWSDEFVRGEPPLRDHSMLTFTSVLTASLIVTVHTRSKYVPSTSVPISGGLVVTVTSGVGTTRMK